MNDKVEKKQEIKWGVVLLCIHLHVIGLYGIWLALTSAKWMTVFFTLIITLLGCLGVTAGAHRLWAHKSYEATTSLRLFLMLAHTLAGAGTIYDWVLYHRLHHKYYGTDKDPYNHSKGFLYSHYLANFRTPKVDYAQAQKEIDMRDVDNDAIVWVQKKFYWVIFGIVGLLLPLNAPLEYWDESMLLTILITGVLRFAITLNVSWLVNSAFHIWNVQRSKVTREGLSIFFITRSNWPAYHYTVPWDWKYNEFGGYNAGYTTLFLKFGKEVGLIDNMLTVTTESVRELLQDVASKKITYEEGIERLYETSKYKAAQERLWFDS